MENLKTLIPTIGDYYPDREQLPRLYLHLPPNMETLRFRSSVSIAKDEKTWAKWVEAFKDPNFLPNLKKLSFVLDLKDGEEGRLGNEIAEKEWAAKQTKLEEKKDEQATDSEEIVECEDTPEDKDGSESHSLQDGNPPLAVAVDAKIREESVTAVNDASHLPVAEDTDEKSPSVEGVETEDSTPKAPYNRRKKEVPEEDLRCAKRACEQLCQAAEERGVKIEPFVNHWSEEFKVFSSHVDKRWEKL
ncbi:MAG: hypothetical protein MMC33_000854 [Icmadophila ericetorum]|nr:hypothetical protein [Icmadophila ericetorum]